MPALYLMSWEPHTRRWTKMYKRRRYTVSCRQLGVPETKQDSYQSANTWWAAKRAEIDGSHPKALQIREQERRLDWSIEHNRTDLIEKLTALITQLKQDTGGNNQPPVPDLSPLRSLRTKEGDELYRAAFEIFSKRKNKTADVIEKVVEERVWQERLSTHPSTSRSALHQDRSVSHQSHLWLEDLRVRVAAGQYGHGEYRGQTSYIRHFVSYLGEQTPIDQINEEKWAGYHRLLLHRIGNGGCSPEYAKKLHRSARSWIEYLTALKRIPEPGNLHDKKMKFTVPKREIETFSVEETTRLLSESRDTVRLFILLALNCGMTQIDISDLSHEEVNWETGRLTRKRSKTADHEKTPLVEYTLWPETFELLTKLRSSDPDRVLTTKSGKPWVNRRETNSDNVRVEFAKLNPSLPFKHLRKSASTMLDGHGEYDRYAQYFLGHAPNNVADSHYVRPNQDRFDCAVSWLREQFLERNHPQSQR